MSIRYDEKGKFFTDYVTKETVAVLVQTTAHRLQGQVHVQPKERLKDALNQSNPFLALTDVSVFDLGGTVMYQTDFIAVNKDHIQWVMPIEDIRTYPIPGEGE